MGVPGFHGHWLRFHAKGALSSILPALVACLYFDLNGYYHAAFKLATKPVNELFQVPGQKKLPPVDRDPVQLMVDVKTKLNELLITAINNVRPVDGVVFAVDGPAPLAKLNQQRSRRFRSAYAPSDPKQYDSNALTPGTEVMFSLEEFMEQFIATYQEYLPPQVIFSGHLIAGEGEHKIMDYLRRGVTTQGLASQQGGAHVIWGLDADLILLSLASPVKNIWLARENSDELVDIERLKGELANRIPNATSRPTLVNDFDLIIELIGNDFLPHQPSLQQTADDIEMLLRVYGEGDYQLTDPARPGEINMPGFLNFMLVLAANEPANLARLAHIPVKFPSRYLQAAVSNGLFNYEEFRNSWYNRALGLKGDSILISGLQQVIKSYQPSVYDINNGTATISVDYGAITANDITKMVTAYLRTLAWSYRYYILGTSEINTDWCYPYHHTPLFSDIALVLSTQPVISGYQAYPGMKMFNALQQMVAVLPSSSVALLPEELRPLMSFNSPIRDLYPVGFQIEMDGRHKEHEGVSLIPTVDRSRIINAVATIPFSPKRLMKWNPGPEIVLTRTVEQQRQINLIREMRERKATWTGAREDRDRSERGDRGQRGGRGGSSQRGGRGGGRGGRTSTGPSQAAPRSNVVPTDRQPVMALPGGGFVAPTPAFPPTAASTSSSGVVPVSQQPVMAFPGAPPSFAAASSTPTVTPAQQPIYGLPGGRPPTFNPGAPVPITAPSFTPAPVSASRSTTVVPSGQQPIMNLPSGAAPVVGFTPTAGLGPAPGPVPTTASSNTSAVKQLKYPSFMLKSLM